MRIETETAADLNPNSGAKFAEDEVLITENAVTHPLFSVLQGSVSFLSTVAFHLLFGCYVFITTCPELRKPQYQWAPNPDGPAVLFTGALIGVYLGGVAWISHQFFRRTLGPSRRLPIMTASGTLASAGLLTILHYPQDWTTLGYYPVPGAVLGLVSGLISASGRNPWDLIIRGLRSKRKEAEPLAVLGGVPLRLAGVIGLLYTVLLLVALQKLFGLIQTRAEVLVVAILLLHWCLTVVVSFVSPPRWIALVTGLLINVPTVYLIVQVFDTAGGLILIPLIYLLVWGLFIVSRPASVRRQNVKAVGIHNVEPAWVKGR